MEFSRVVTWDKRAWKSGASETCREKELVSMLERKVIPSKRTVSIAEHKQNDGNYLRELKKAARLTEN